MEQTLVAGLVDIVNPTTANVVNTSQWSIATQLGGTTGDFAPTSNTGHETWTFLFDHSAESNGTSPLWERAALSKVCCGPVNRRERQFRHRVDDQLDQPIQALTGYERRFQQRTLPNRDSHGLDIPGLDWLCTGSRSTRKQTSSPPIQAAAIPPTYLFNAPTPANYSGFQFVFHQQAGDGE